MKLKTENKNTEKNNIETQASFVPNMADYTNQIMVESAIRVVQKLPQTISSYSEPFSKTKRDIIYVQIIEFIKLSISQLHVHNHVREMIKSL